MNLNSANWSLALVFLPMFAHAAELGALRLGDVATPTFYQLRVAIDPAQPTFEGEVRIEMLVNRETPAIRLNAQDLEIEQATFTQGELPIPVTTRRESEDRVAFEATGEKFLFGTTTAVIRYRGRIDPVATRGLFRQAEAGEAYVTSQFEALNARRAIPTFDEPSWKTPWEVVVDAPSANRVLANAPEAAVADVPGREGWKRHRFVRTPPLPSYLVALAVGPYDLVDGGKAGIQPTPLRYAAPRGRGAEARYVHEATPRIVALLEDYFGTPHPFAKLDSVALAGSARFGAMENAAMVTYERGLLLARPQDDSLGFRRTYVSVGAHEIAHQWFGDLVTAAWWDDIWLNEAFASWMARKTVRAFQPEWDSGWRRGDNRRRALAADRLTTARQVRNPVRERNDIAGAFDAITYRKGAEVLSMFESFLGEAAFQRGVRDYLARHAWSNATSDDFFEAIARASGRAEAVQAMRGFVDQPGLPLVDVALACNASGASLRVAQRRFAGVGQAATAQRWRTPACFRYRAGGQTARQCVAIGSDPATVVLESPGCPDWIAANADGAGHWVARYDAALLKTLETRIVDVPEDEAVAFAGDTALLVASGLLSRDAGLRLATAFLRHPGLGVRQGGIAFLQSLPEETLAAGTRQARHILLTSYVHPMARSVGWLDRPADDLATQEFRAAVMPYAARMPGGEALRAPARDLALRWLDDRASLPASSLRAVLQTALRFSDAGTFDRFVAALAATTEPRERNEMVVALAVARDPAQRARAMDIALRGAPEGLQPAEALLLAETALADDANRVAAFAALRDRWDAWLAKLPPDTAARLIDPLASLCTRRDRQEFAAFFQGRAPGLREGPRKYAQALEAIDVCVAAAAAQPAQTVTRPQPRKARAGRGRR